MTIDAPLLSVRRLTLAAADTTLVDDLSFDLARGECLAMVGESGSGKTLAARAVLGLLPPGVVRTRGEIILAGVDLASADEGRMRALRGPSIGMVFQEPMVSLNPAMRIGAQLEEGLKLHTKLGRAERRAACLDALDRVRIADPQRCYDAYAHEFSGGMRQRIMLASVMLLKPRLLIADEPTTALDTLAQREVLDLMMELARDEGTAVLLITHDLGVIAQMADRVAVMYAGRFVENGSVRGVVKTPRHPYTLGLLSSTVLHAAPGARLATIPGTPPDLAHLPPGCSFARATSSQPIIRLPCRSTIRCTRPTKRT